MLLNIRIRPVEQVGQALLVGPGGVAEDAVQPLWVGFLDGARGVLDGLPHVPRRLAHIASVGAGRDLEAVRLGEETLVHPLAELLA
jgi:hypothetical protein